MIYFVTSLLCLFIYFIFIYEVGDHHHHGPRLSAPQSTDGLTSCPRVLHNAGELWVGRGSRYR